MTLMKNQHDELRVCIDYKKLNQVTRKYHFPLPFIDQVLEKLVRKSHYCFLDGFFGYMQIHIAPEDQHKTTFTCPFGTFAYTRMPFGLCNAPSTFECCMTISFRIYLRYVRWQKLAHHTSFNACLENLSRVLTRCMDTNLVLHFEKCHFMVTEGIGLGHLVSSKGIEVDKSKVDMITSLPNRTYVQEVRSFVGHARFYRRFIKNFSKIAMPLSKLLQKDELKTRLTSTPILQAPNWEYPFELMCDASNSALGPKSRSREASACDCVCVSNNGSDPIESGGQGDARWQDQVHPQCFPKGFTFATEPCPLYSTSMGWCTELPQHTIRKQMVKLKCLIGKSRKLYKRWRIPAGRIGVDSLTMCSGHTRQHTGLHWGCLPTGLSSVKPATYRLNWNIALIGQILRKEFRVGQKVLLFNSKFKLIAVKLKDETTNNNFQVNGHQLKIFHEGPTPTMGKMESISIMEPAPTEGHTLSKPQNPLYIHVMD
ncbi:Retrovirus-related Pol polyprotein, partial [Mucuna pruriens]